MIITTYSLLKEKTRYLQAFFANPRAFGAIAPSSSVLCRTKSEAVNWEHIQNVAELGAGDGVLTQHLLCKMSATATLAAYEINQQLAYKLTMINDSRLSVYIDSAENLKPGYDAIFSGLPLISLQKPLRQKILLRIVSSLNPGGFFVQFQYTSLSEPLLSKYFLWARSRVIRNLPPAFVYRCQVAMCH